MNCGIGSAFDKGTGSEISESSGLGPGPLYKLCLMIILKIDITIKSILATQFLNLFLINFFLEIFFALK